MPRQYGHVKEYENEILRFKKEGLTHREIGERLGFTKNQIKSFLNVII